METNEYLTSDPALPNKLQNSRALLGRRVAFWTGLLVLGCAIVLGSPTDSKSCSFLIHVAKGGLFDFSRIEHIPISNDSIIDQSFAPISNGGPFSVKVSNVIERLQLYRGVRNADLFPRQIILSVFRCNWQIEWVVDDFESSECVQHANRSLPVVIKSRSAGGIVVVFQPTAILPRCMWIRAWVFRLVHRYWNNRTIPWRIPTNTRAPVYRASHLSIDAFSSRAFDLRRRRLRNLGHRSVRRARKPSYRLSDLRDADCWRVYVVVPVRVSEHLAMAVVERKL
jgi:hypothetical protein